jgi:hypothetical protein
MVIAVAMAMLALQHAPAAAAPVNMDCSLVTPAGDPVGFTLIDAAGQDPELVPADRSVWPTRTLPARRGVLTGSPGASGMFATGSGDGLALDVSEAAPNESLRQAILYRRDRLRVGVPIAFGFCAVLPDQPIVYEGAGAAADPREIGANIPAFDPAHWPAADCGLILSDGRRVPFRFTLPNRDQVRLWSPALWADGPVTMAMRWDGGARAMSGSFARSGGPSGRQATAVSVPLAVRLIRLWEIGGSTGLTGFGICGMQLVRRAA